MVEIIGYLNLLDIFFFSMISW